MREPKKVKMGNQTERFPKSRKERCKAADQELWNKLNKIGLTSSSHTISSGSAAIDERLRKTIGAPKGDPTVGLWHGTQTGHLPYPGTMITVTQYRRQVWKTTEWKNGTRFKTAYICDIWLDDTVDTPAEENKIAELFGGDFLTSVPLGTPFEQYTRRYNRAPDDPAKANNAEPSPR